MLIPEGFRQSLEPEPRRPFTCTWTLRIQNAAKLEENWLAGQEAGQQGSGGQVGEEYHTMGF